MANARILELLQQCLESLTEFVECEGDAGLTRLLRKLRVELHDFFSHALCRQQIDAVCVHRVGEQEAHIGSREWTPALSLLTRIYV